MNYSQNLYTEISNSYRSYSSRKEKYLNSIDCEVIKFIQKYQPKKIIDIGTGDGYRFSVISRYLPLTSSAMLMDNCPQMLKIAKEANFSCSVEFNSFSIEGTDPIKKSHFDMALCLWNVLGHIEYEKIPKALKNIHNCLDVNGLFVLDINNKYNCKEYGIKNVIKNLFLDLFLDDSKNSTFDLEINGYKSKVNILNKKHIRALLTQAGFEIIKTVYVNYSCGRVETSQFGGQILIVAKKL